mgnify:CR=1 FL=1
MWVIVTIVRQRLGRRIVDLVRWRVARRNVDQLVEGREVPRIDGIAGGLDIAGSTCCRDAHPHGCVLKNTRINGSLQYWGLTLADNRICVVGTVRIVHQPNLDQVCGGIELNPGLKTEISKLRDAGNAQSIDSLNSLQAIDVDSDVARAWVIKLG